MRGANHKWVNGGWPLFSALVKCTDLFHSSVPLTPDFYRMTYGITGTKDDAWCLENGAHLNAIKTLLRIAESQVLLLVCEGRRLTHKPRAPVCPLWDCVGTFKVENAWTNERLCAERSGYNFLRLINEARSSSSSEPRLNSKKRHLHELSSRTSLICILKLSEGFWITIAQDSTPIYVV